MPEKHIAKVVRFDNGMVMVFGDDGQQMTEYQGRFEDVHLQIWLDAADDTQFYAAEKLNGELCPIDKAAFQFSNS